MLSCAVRSLRLSYFLRALACGTACLNQPWTGRITPTNLPVTYSHGSVSGFRSFQQMIPPPVGHPGYLWRCFLNTERMEATTATERQNWGLVGRVSPSFVLRQTAPAVGKWIAQNPSLEPCFSSHKCKACFLGTCL